MFGIYLGTFSVPGFAKFRRATKLHDTGQAAVAALCVVCREVLPDPATTGHPRRYCGAACRSRAYRSRLRERLDAPVPTPPSRDDFPPLPVALDPQSAALIAAVQRSWDEHLARLRRNHDSPPVWPLHEALRECLPELLERLHAIFDGTL